MAKTNNLSDFLNDLADGIRTVTGGTADIPAQDFSTEIKKLKPSSYINPTGTKTITSSGTHDVKDYASASVASGAYSASTTLTAGDGSVYAYGNKVTLSTATTTAPSDWMYYVEVKGSGTVSATGTATIGTAGFLDKGSKVSASSSKSSNTATKYYTLPTGGATVSGGDLTAGSGKVSATGSSVTLTEVNTEPTSGYYITAVGSGTVTRSVINRAYTEGYVPGTAAEQVIASGSKESNSQTKYYTVATETKTVTSSTSTQTVTPSSGKLLSSVTVNAIDTATQATPSISVSSTGLITASATQTAGYVSAGTESATKQLTTKAATTITPTSSSQTAVASGTYTTGTITVAAVPTETKTATPTSSSQSITPSSGKFLSKVTVNATPTETKTATPTKSTQTISPASGKFLSSVTVNPIPSDYIIPSGTRSVTSNGTFDVTSYASVSVAVPAVGHTVYKHTITLTAPGATGSYGTSTISCSNVYLYSTSLSTSIAGEYNASNWATLVGHFRNSFNTVEAIVNPYNSGNCKGISTSCTGSDGYLGTIYVLDYNGYIGGYLNYTYSSISYGSASASNYFLKNFNSGNVIVTDVVTEL